jgi:hypothetical protein
MERVHDEMPSLQHVGQLFLERDESFRQKQSLSTLRQEHQTYGWASTCSFVVRSRSRRFPGAKPVARRRCKCRSHRPAATAVLPTTAGGLTFRSRRTASPPLNSSVRPQERSLGNAQQNLWRHRHPVGRRASFSLVHIGCVKRRFIRVSDRLVCRSYLRHPHARSWAVLFFSQAELVAAQTTAHFLNIVLRPNISFKADGCAAA